MNRTLLANLAAATAALSAGAGVVATRIAVGETDPVSLAFYRYVIAGACLAPVLFALWPKDGLPLRDVGKIAVLGAVFFGFFPWAFSAALQYTTAARGAIGLATIPVQTLLVAVLFGREALARNKIASVALAFAGIAVVFGPAALAGQGAQMLKGDLLMLLGAFSAAIYSTFSRPTLGRHGPLFVTALAIPFGVVALAPLAALNGAVTHLPAFSLKGWAALIFLGTFGGAIQFVLYSWALRWLTPSRTAIHLTLNPITAMLLGGLILGESVTALLVLGLALVLAGILAATVWKPAEASVPAAARG